MEPKELRNFIRGLESHDLSTLITITRAEQVYRSRQSSQKIKVPEWLQDSLIEYFSQLKRGNNTIPLGLNPVAGITYHIWPALKFFLEREFGSWITNDIIIRNVNYTEDQSVLSIDATTCETCKEGRVKAIEFTINEFSSVLTKGWQVYMNQKVKTTKGKSVGYPSAYSNQLAPSAIPKYKPVKEVSRKQNVAAKLVLEGLTI